MIIRQSGRRPIAGSLGDESFDEVVSCNVYYAETTSCSGRSSSSPDRTGCAIIKFYLEDLVKVDSTLTFSGGPLESPVTVDLNFGDPGWYDCSY